MKYRFVALIAFSFVCFLYHVPVQAHELPDGAVPLARSEECAACHPTIYKEWKDSFHAKSSALEDPAHGAVHRAFVKAMEEKGEKGNYHCANCHAPMADNIKELMTGTAELDSENWTHTEGTGCSFCHRVESIVEQEMFNQYRLNTDGALHTGRPAKEGLPHKMGQSALFAEGKICMGCHSHKLNAKHVPVCLMKDQARGNCLECHMPEVEGRATVGTDGKTHRSHKMPGGHDTGMLKKAAGLDAEVTSEGDGRTLVVTVKNLIKHTFPSTNPMRIAFVKAVGKDKDGNKVWENFSHRRPITGSFEGEPGHMKWVN